MPQRTIWPPLFPYTGLAVVYYTVGTAGQHLCPHVEMVTLRCSGTKDLLVPQVLRQRQEGEAMALRSVQKLQEERRLLQERLGSLQRALAQLEAEKRELERSALQLDKDRVALRKTLDKVPALLGRPLVSGSPDVRLSSRDPVSPLHVPP